jgi:tetratricopeptide (TPR) repeat protein
MSQGHVRSVGGAAGALLALALSLVAGARTAAAADDFQRQEALRHYRAGLDAMQAESWDEAAAQFRMAIKLDPLLTLAHYGLGQTRMAVRAYPEAVTAFTRTIAAHRENDALRMVGDAEVDQRIEDQIRELQDGLRAVEGSAKLRAMGLRDNMVLKLEEQIRALQDNKRRNASAAEVPAEFSLALGSAHFRSGQLQDAEREYQAAIRVNSKMGEAHNNLAVVYLMTGRPAEAEASLQQAEKAGYRVNPQLKKDIVARRN